MLNFDGTGKNVKLIWQLLFFQFKGTSFQTASDSQYVALVLKLLPLHERRCINLASSAIHNRPGTERLYFSNMLLTDRK